MDGYKPGNDLVSCHFSILTNPAHIHVHIHIYIYIYILYIYIYICMYIHMCLSFFVKTSGGYAVCRFSGVLVEGGTV